MRFAKGFAGVIFRFCLLATALLAALVFVFGKPDTVKQTLKDSGIYGNFADGVIQQAQEEKPDKESGDVPIKNRAVQKAIKSALSEDFAQDTSEEVIDGVYNWLEGKTPQPDFVIDISGVKKKLANDIGDAAVQRAEKLPVCTPEQLSRLDAKEADLFSIPCRIPGLNLQAERKRLVSEALAGDEFIEDTKISAQSLKAEGQTEDPFQQASYVPQLFQLAKVLPWILGLLGILVGAGVVLWDTDRRHGVKVLCRTLLLTAVLLAIAVPIMNYLVNKIPVGDSLADTQDLQRSAIYIVKSLGGSYNGVLLVFAGVYGVLGVGGLVWLRSTRKTVNTPAQKPAPRPKK